MNETPQITQTQAQPTAVIRLTIPRSEIQQVMGPAIGEVMATVAEQGIGPVGPLYSYHFRMDPEVFDFEVGAPVSAPVQPQGRVVAGNLPATKVVRTVYQGPYEGLGAAWGEFDAWIKSQNLKASSALWECYLAGPETGPDASRYRTELTRPLAD